MFTVIQFMFEFKIYNLMPTMLQVWDLRTRSEEISKMSGQLKFFCQKRKRKNSVQNLWLNSKLSNFANCKYFYYRLDIAWKVGISFKTLISCYLLYAKIKFFKTHSLTFLNSKVTVISEIDQYCQMKFYCKFGFIFGFSHR